MNYRYTVTVTEDTEYPYQCGVHVWRTRDAAESWCHANNAWLDRKALLAELPGAFAAREEYAAQAQAFGVRAWTDEEIRRNDYAFVYGEFTAPEYSLDQLTERALAGRRRAYLLESATVTDATRPSADDYPAGRRLTCGHIVYNSVEVMHASLGTACADCYDRLSD